MRPSRCKGFTLIEVTVALALGSVVLVCVMSMFVAFSQAWEMRRTPYEAFVEHVDQCARLLTHQARTFVPVMTEQGVEARYAQTVLVKKTNQPILAFFQPEPLPFIDSLEDQLGVWVGWVWDRSGLFLQWETPEMVKKRFRDGVEASGKTKMQSFLLSPYVQKIEYGCVDSKGHWVFAKNLQQLMNRFNGKLEERWRPHGARLTFRKNDWEAVRFIYFKGEQGFKKLETANTESAGNTQPASPQDNKNASAGARKAGAA